MTIDEIRALTSEDVKNMSKQEALSILKEANKKARDVRDRAKRLINKNPDVPIPTIYRNYDGKSWLEKSFALPTDTKIYSIKRELNDVIDFLNAKTSLYSNWQKTLKGFVESVVEKADIYDDEGNKITPATLNKRYYKRFWGVIGKLQAKLGKEGLSQYAPSDQVQTMLYEEMSKNKRMGIDKLVDAMLERLEITGTQREKTRLEEESKRLMGIKFGRRGLD